LLKFTDHPKVVGIGEAGLDYFYKNSTPGNQARGFRAHIEAARTSGLPLIVHTRDADEDTLSIMRDELKKGRYEAVVHCYSSSPELGFEAIELGFYLGLGGILTFARSDELRETVRKIPMDRLLLETDSPYLTPAPFRKVKTNEPCYVPHVAAKLAEVKQVDLAEVERATTDNFFRLFSKARRPDA
jgi:TatD DNase family protein